jgi:hypothetical protein
MSGRLSEESDDIMKKPLLTLALAAACTPAWSAAPAPALDGLIACADVQDTQQRLACFDREIAPLARAARTTAPASAAVARAPAPAAAPTPAPATGSTASSKADKPSFGQEQLRAKERPAAPEEEPALHAQIATLRETAPGTWLVALDNGQTWRHEDSQLGAYLRVGEAVTIRKSTLGAYRMTRDAGQARDWIRVTRVR